MIHIILTILKFVGILLLILLCIALAIILAVLFVPFGYQVRAQGSLEKKTINGKAGVNWLFYLIYLELSYQQGKKSMELYILGIPVMRMKKWIVKLLKKTRIKRKKKVSEKEEPPKEDARTTQFEAASQVVTPKAETEKTAYTGQPEHTRQPEHTGTENMKSIEAEPQGILEKLKIKLKAFVEKLKKTLSGILHLPSEIIKRIKKIRLTFDGICDNIKKWCAFMKMDTTKQAIRFVKQKGISLLRHILPRKIRGNITFGFDDPSLTGQLLAAVGLLYPLYGKKLQMEPVFDRVALEGEIKLHGHVIAAYLLWQVWLVYRNKEIRVTWQRFQHKEA